MVLPGPVAVLGQRDMSMSESRKAKKIDSATIRRTENGGYIVSQSYDNRDAGPSWQPSKEFAFSSKKKAMDHVAECFGEE